MIGLFKGLATTLSTFSRRPVTVQYPDEKRVLPVRQRSFPVLTWDFDHDEPFCTGCNVCVRNCPVDCMTATMQDNPAYAAGTSDRRKIVEKFWIDYARCMRCNICVEVCPFEAIVMDNTWSGHEHAAYDRLDLHMDIDDLLSVSKSGQLTNPFRPQDRIELIEALEKGEEPPPRSFQGAWPEARQRQAERVARGEQAAIQLREPEKPKVSAKAAAAAAGAEGEVEILTANKIRAKRMRAEKTAQEYRDRGEEVPAEVLADIEKYSKMKPGEAAGGAAPAAAAPAAAAGAAGDPNSSNKVRARRMRAEKKAKEALDAGEAIPDDVMAILVETGSEMAPAEARAAAAAKTAVAAGGDEEGGMSANKLRAKRMRAERQAKEALARGEEIPADVLATIQELGGEVPTSA